MNGTSRPEPGPPHESDPAAPTPDAMRLSFELDFPSDVRYIERIVDLVRYQCTEFQYPGRVCTLNVPVALTEALANAILRGNHEDPRKLVRVRAAMDVNAIVLEVQDEGDGFDVDAFEPDTDGANWLEREDGRGLFLMRKLMDRVERVPADVPGTVVRLTLRRP
jgi:serine/threonine-protein kinase RsbW